VDESARPGWLVANAGVRHMGGVGLFTMLARVGKPISHVGWNVGSNVAQAAYNVGAYVETAVESLY